MKYHLFGNTSMNVSEMGYGAWAIGGAAKVGSMPIGWGPSNDAVAIQSLYTAKEVGINFFDTADFYGFGHSENLIGKVFGNDQSIYVATKVGQKVNESNQIAIDYSKAHILKSCEDSLKRLQRETIDYYQLHVANITHLQQGDCLEAMELLMQQGKIKYWGISLFTYEPFAEANYILEHQLGHGFQLVFNIINQKAFPLLAKMKAQGYGIIARMPLQFGLLTGKFSAHTIFDESDHRSFRLNAAIIEAAHLALAPIWQLCEKYQCTKIQLALSFIAAFPEISTIIPGIRTPEQAIQNANAIIALDETDKQWIQAQYSTTLFELLEAIRKLG